MSSPLAGAEMMTFFAPPSMCLRAASAFGEASGGLEHDVDAEVLPRQRRRILLGEDSDLVAVDGDRAVRRRDVALVRAVHRVVLEEVRERLRIGQVVDGDELDVGDTLLLRGAKHLSSDASKAVDANANRHPFVLLCGYHRSPSAGARPKVTKLTMRAPPSQSAAAHAFSVAAVVTTSSTTTTCAPRSICRADAGARNAPETLRRRSPGVNRVCVSV